MSLYSRAPSRALPTFTGTSGLVRDGRCTFLNILGGVSASDCSCECEMTSWREKGSYFIRLYYTRACK